MYSKDLVSNASTGLMAIKDIATHKEVPINIHFADHRIHVIVGFGTSRQKKCLSTRRIVIGDLRNPMKYTTESKKLWMN